MQKKSPFYLIYTQFLKTKIWRGKIKKHITIKKTFEGFENYKTIDNLNKTMYYCYQVNKQRQTFRNERTQS